MLLKSLPKKKFYGMSAVGGKAAAVVAAFAKGVNFNGATYIASSPADTALTTTDGKRWICSLWFRATIAPGEWSTLFGNSTGRGFSISKSPDGSIYFAGADSAADNALTVIASAAPIVDTAVWHHLLVAADNTSTPVGRVVLDGVLQGTNGFAYNALNVNFAAANTKTIGANMGYSFGTGDVAELYIAHNQYLDLTVSANVLKFRSVSGHPVDLGTSGATPTGTAPTCYFSVRAPSGVHNDFLTNRGTGGLTWAVAGGTLGLATVDP